MSKMVTMSDPAVDRILERAEELKKMKEQEAEYRRNWEKLHEQKICRVDIKPLPVKDEKLFYKVLPDGSWKGRRCFVVGGGPSLKNFDFSRLKGELTIGVNRAFEKLDCTIMFAIDKHLYEWITDGDLGEKAKKRFEKFKGYKVWLPTLFFPYDGVYLLESNGSPGISFSMKDGLSHGNNSGYAAMNLAVCLGANPIYLLGFDMKGKDGKQAWWHDGYPDNQGDGVYSNFKDYFNKAAEILKEKGVRVINLNPDSALKCFEFGNVDDILPEKRKDENLVLGDYYGLGDNLYERPFVKEACRRYKNVYLSTPFPDLYPDRPKNLHFSRPATQLRIQKKNIENQSKDTWKEPFAGDHFRFDYHTGRMQRGMNIIEAFEDSAFPLEDPDFTLPVDPSWTARAKKVLKKVRTEKKICIVKYPTLRKEWENSSRLPKTEYLQLIIDRYRDEYFFISVGAVEEGEEWPAGNIAGIDLELHNNELDIFTVFGLVALSDMVIGYPSFFIPLCIMLKKKFFCIFGGEIRPELLIDERMDLRSFAFVAPEPFCGCFQKKHDCRKDIPCEKIIAEFESLKSPRKKVKKAVIAVPAGIADMHWVMTKLESFKKKNGIDILKVAVHEDYGHSNSAEYLEMLPFVDNVIRSPHRFKFDLSMRGGKGEPLRKGDNGIDYIMEFNSRLEEGVPLKDILPEYDTNFDIPLDIPPEAVEFAAKLKVENGGKLYLIYASSNRANLNWAKGSWLIDDWLKLTGMISEKTGKRAILLGREWDKDFSDRLLALDSGKTIVDLVSKTNLSQVLALIREADFLVSFLCGLAIMSVQFRTPTVTFWPIKGTSPGGEFDRKFMRSWLPPWAKNYFPFIYGQKKTNPEEVFKAVREFL